MKFLPLFFAAGAGLVLALLPARAAAGQAGARLAFLSADDRSHFLKVREETLSKNPDLKTEQDSLAKEMAFVKGQGSDASVEDRQTLRQNFMAHNEKMQAAMLKTDPSIAPVLDQVKAKMKERFQQRTAGKREDN